MTTIFGRLRRFAPALLCLTGFACMTYPVTPVNELRPGNSVQLTLTDSAIPALAPRLGPGVFRVQGKLQEVDSLALLLQVSNTTSARNIDYHFAPSMQWGGGAVSIPRTGVAAARQGHFSLLRTALGIAFVGGAAALTASLMHHAPAQATRATYP